MCPSFLEGTLGSRLPTISRRFLVSLQLPKKEPGLLCPLIAPFHPPAHPCCLLGVTFQTKEWHCDPCLGVCFWGRTSRRENRDSELGPGAQHLLLRAGPWRCGMEVSAGRPWPLALLSTVADSGLRGPLPLPCHPPLGIWFPSSRLCLPHTCWVAPSESGRVRDTNTGPGRLQVPSRSCLWQAATGRLSRRLPLSAQP